MFDILSVFIVVVGLVVFEVVNSIDNAIVNAHILKTMSQWARRWFLIWGLITAVFLIRGVLPFLILWLTHPDVSFIQAWHIVFSGDINLSKEHFEETSFILLLGGGMFLLLLYFHWLFLEKKNPFFPIDKLIEPRNYGVWFFAVAALLLVLVLYFARENPIAMLSAAVGNAGFFILYGFRETAEKEEQKMLSGQSTKSDISKLLFLEVLDASFSIDSVVGAFAFTTSIPLILLGNGIGALVVRELTIKSIDKVAKYRWLKNGAMTSIGFLGGFMILEGFGVHIPEWLPTLTTIGLVGVAFYYSRKLIKKQGNHLV
ncbi:hypothetical protein HRbin34_00222 [bacterium HR34]|nr:hypothetical protein HRbin34_00222 [bacterium HR34]